MSNLKHTYPQQKSNVFFSLYQANKMLFNLLQHSSRGEGEGVLR